MTDSSAIEGTTRAGEGAAGACNCKAEVNAMLAEHNTQLDFNYMNDRDIFIRTIKLDEKKRGRAAAMFATFCPFCGESLAPAATPQANTEHQNADKTK